jgi:hypothetical protein
MGSWAAGLGARSLSMVGLLIVIFVRLIRLVVGSLRNQGLYEGDLLRRDAVALAKVFIGPEAIHLE